MKEWLTKTSKFSLAGITCLSFLFVSNIAHAQSNGNSQSTTYNPHVSAQHSKKKTKTSRVVSTLNESSSFQSKTNSVKTKTSKSVAKSEYRENLQTTTQPKFGNLTTSNSTSNSDSISGYKALDKLAEQQLATPYVWGGSLPGGFDCSGFTQYVYQNALHISLPRTAQAQYNFGKSVSESQAKKGDLVFFGSDASSIEHVGIYMGNGKMIDAQNNGVVIEAIHAPWWSLVGYASITK